ncbi:MAG: hypothetical protein ACOYL5_09630 [Phototrophicaceae bacterium]
MSDEFAGYKLATWKSDKDEDYNEQVYRHKAEAKAAALGWSRISTPLGIYWLHDDTGVEIRRATPPDWKPDRSERESSPQQMRLL